ncbi:MAG: peptidase M48, partial [Bacteroidota bacterium]
YVENNYFYHPVLKFQFPIPNAWQTSNSPQQFQMAPQDGKAMMALSLGQGSSPDAAANAFVSKNQLTLVQSNRLTVNGFPAVAVISDQVNQEEPQGSLRILSYFIQYNNSIYMINGIALRTDFNRYENTFRNTMRNFRKLTDPNKINVKPELIRVKSVTKSNTLRNALRYYSVPANRLEELAVLNGMQLNDQVTKGTLIKVIGK